MLFNTAIAYGLLCALAHLVLLKIFSRKDFGVRDFKKKITIVNRIVCAAHAAFMTGLTIYYWCSAPLTPLWVYSGVPFAKEVDAQQDFAIQCMLGYLVTDTFVEARYGKGWMTLAHHFCGVTSHLVTIIENDGTAAAYSMLVYMAESSTPFLHTSWILKEINRGEGLFFMFNVIVMICNFFLFRVVLSPYIFWHMIQNWWPVASTYVFYMNFVLAIVFIGLNYYWFYLIVQVIPIPGLGNKKKLKPKKKLPSGEKIE